MEVNTASPETITLCSSRLKYFCFAMLCFLISFIGLDVEFWVNKSPGIVAVSLALLAFMSLGAALFSCLVIVPAKLTINKNGFREKVAFHDNQYEWCDISEFGIQEIYVGLLTFKKVSFNTSFPNHSLLIKVASFGSYYKYGLSNNYRKKPEELLALLNTYHAAAKEKA